MASVCSWPAPMPMSPPWWMSAEAAAMSKASFPPAGIPPRSAACPTARWWCSTARAAAPTRIPERTQSRASGPTRSCRRRRRRRGAIRRPHADRHRFVDRTLQRSSSSTRGPRPALANSPYRDAKLDEPNPLPPIEHVIYIVKENRTYDQVLGDMKEGNGDPSLVLFGENITPNQHKLAREFVLLDNFYVNCRCQRRRPQLVHRRHRARLRAEDVAQQLRQPPQPLRLRRAGSRRRCRPPATSGPTPRAAGISMRNYGYMVNNKRQGRASATEQITGVRDPGAGQGRPTAIYRGFDLDYPDMERAKVFLTELAEFEKAGTMPRLMVMRLGNDHTSGTPAGKIAPLSAGGRQRLRPRHDWWRQFRRAGSGPDRDLRPGRRCAERPRPRGFAPLAGLRDFALRETPRGGQHDVQHHVDAAHHGVHAGPAADDAFRRRRAAHDRGLPDDSPIPPPYTAEKPRISLDERNPAPRRRGARPRTA